jgi:hypothetical protein
MLKRQLCMGPLVFAAMVHLQSGKDPHFLQLWKLWERFFGPASAKHQFWWACEDLAAVAMSSYSSLLHHL